MANEIIKVKNENGRLLVSARDLHEVFVLNEGKKERFSQWFERHLQYGFEENIDYTSVKIFTVVNNGAKRELDDYACTIDMAKELAMLQKSDKGREFRKYFIECEKQLTQQVPQITAEDKSILTIIKSTSQEERMMALIEYKEIVTKPLVEKIELDAPKVDAFDTYMDKDGLYTVTNVSKLLNIKRKDLYQWLRDEELVYKRKCICTVKAQDLEIAKMKINNGHDSLYITPKGVEYIRNNFVKED